MNIIPRATATIGMINTKTERWVALYFSSSFVQPIYPYPATITDW